MVSNIVTQEKWINYSCLIPLVDASAKAASLRLALDGFHAKRETGKYSNVHVNVSVTKTVSYYGGSCFHSCCFGQSAWYF